MRAAFRCVGVVSVDLRPWRKREASGRRRHSTGRRPHPRASRSPGRRPTIWRAGSPRFEGGFAYTTRTLGTVDTRLRHRALDVGPGESSSFPTKWMSADGRTVHLVFPGEDAFPVRRATVNL